MPRQSSAWKAYSGSERQQEDVKAGKISDHSNKKTSQSSSSSSSRGSSGSTRSNRGSSGGSSSGKSSKTPSGNVKQGGNGEKTGSSNGLTPPPGYTGPIPPQAPSIYDEGEALAGEQPSQPQDPDFVGPPAPTNQQDDISQLDTSSVVKKKLRESGADNPVETMQNKNETYYTLVGRGQSVEPAAINPITGEKISGTGTVEKAWEQGGKQTTRFAAVNLGVIPFAAGTTIAATGPVAAAGAAKLGLTGAAASAVKFGAGFSASVLAPTISQEIYKQSKRGTTDYDKITDPMFQTAYKQAQQDYYQSLQDPSVDNTFKKIGSWIPGVAQGLESGSIKQGVTEYYLDQGYSKKEAKQLGQMAYELTLAKGTGDVFGTIGIETSSEILGRKLSSKLFTKVSGSEVTKITKSALLSLPVAGFLEGSGEYTKTRLMENEPVKLWETTNIPVPYVENIPIPSGVVGAGLFGSAFATSLGAPIARFAKTRPKTSKGLLTFARVSDPYEITGDVLGEAIVKGKFGGVRSFSFASSTSTAQAQQTADSIMNNVMSGKSKSGPLGSSGPIIDITPNAQRGGISVTDIVSTGTTPSNVPSNVNAIVNVPTSVPIPTDVPSNVPTPTNVPTPVITPMPGPIIITDTTPTDVPTNVPTDVPSNVPTTFTTPAPVDTPVPISVTTPTPRLPFFPISGGGGRGSRGFGMGDLGKYYSFSEFKVPSLSKLFKTSGISFTPKKTKRSKKKKRETDPLKKYLGDIKI